MTDIKQTQITKWGNARINHGGYYTITSSKEGNNMKYLHRLIFEDYHKCTICPNASIHHIDGDKTNNNIDNLKLISKSQHSKLHHTGRPCSDETKEKLRKANKGRTLSEETKRKMSENHYDISGENNPNYHKYGEKHHGWKDYARIIKKGKKKGKQLYGIMFKGELIKCSLYPYKLEIWFNKTHPNQRLVNKFGSG